ncbi:unnamed protein product, partial [Allacma fusca]
MSQFQEGKMEVEPKLDLGMDVPLVSEPKESNDLKEANEGHDCPPPPPEIFQSFQTKPEPDLCAKQEQSESVPDTGANAVSDDRSQCLVC